MAQLTGRFAPSPSGRMHLGNVFCALFAWLFCRKENGNMVLRIEDLDPARCKPQYTAQLIEDLTFLGLDWDPGGNEPGFLQSQRSDYYAACFDKLRQTGLVYPCFCSRNELHDASAPHASDGSSLYTGRCKNLTPEQKTQKSLTRSPAWRLAVENAQYTFADILQGRVTQALAQECGDFILRRSDGVFAYQLAVVADDAAMGVTQVVRGSDLLSSTPRQLYLYDLLGYTPPTYAHLPLLLSESGARLSKRDKSLDLGALRAAGVSAEQILGALGWLGGILQTNEPAALRELLSEFSAQKVRTENIVVPSNLLT